MIYFGTDGIRQKAEEFTPEFLAKIVKGLVDYAGDEIKVLIGGDTRESSEWILADLETALETFGLEYGNVGVLPTPGINYCFFNMGFDFAIDVTASHNPYTDNGIKIFERGKNYGQKLSEEGCETIEKALSAELSYTPASTSLREDLHADALELYTKHLTDYLGDADFSELKLGMDCANGATSVINKTIFEQFGAQVSLIHADPEYGTKINHNCGSTHLESLQELVTKNHLDFGIAFDGDGDRCLLVDVKGNVDIGEITHTPAFDESFKLLNRAFSEKVARDHDIAYHVTVELHLKIDDAEGVFFSPVDGVIRQIPLVRIYPLVALISPKK